VSICTAGFASPAPVKGAAADGDASAKAPAIAAVPRASFNFILFSSRECVQPLQPTIGVRSIALQVTQQVITALKLNLAATDFAHPRPRRTASGPSRGHCA